MVRIYLTFYDNGVQTEDALITTWEEASGVIINYLSEAYFYFDEEGCFVVDENIKQIRNDVLDQKNCQDAKFLSKFIPKVFSNIKICHFDFDFTLGEHYYVRGIIKDGSDNSNKVFLIEVFNDYEEEENNE